MSAPPPANESVPIQRFGLVDSTSLHARRFIGTGAASTPILFVADEQTGGVGRFARPWASPRGGLWCTLLWPLARDKAKREAMLHGLGLRVGVACLETIQAALAGSGLDVRLKWPNDVLVTDQKVLGVLTEVVAHPHHPPHPPKHFALVGVGVNANLDPGDLPGPLRPTATTLRALTGRDFDLTALAADLGARLGRALSYTGGAGGAGGGVIDPETLAAARASLARVGRPIKATLPDRTAVEGTLTGLSDAGTPVIETGSGPVTLPSWVELQ